MIRFNIYTLVAYALLITAASMVLGFASYKITGSRILATALIIVGCQSSVYASKFIFKGHYPSNFWGWQ